MFDITALAGPFGALVHGWNPGRAPSASEADELRAALRSHRLLVLRGQPRPSNEEFARLGRSFGELFAGGESYGLESDNDDVLRISNELDSDGYEVGYAGSGYLPWHTDYSFRERAAKETLLEAVLLPENGPRTHWVDTYTAYEQLDPQLRERIRGRVGRHDPYASARHIPQQMRADPTAYGERVNPSAHLPYAGKPIPHPLAHVHPESGRTALYVSTFVSSVDSLPDPEGRALVDTLLEHTLRPEWTYSHEWREGDLVVFDTVGTIHSRDTSDPGATRSMRQMSTLLPA
jgi:alpha-ketoglutarate-dependent taurine dioxygenase